MRIDLKDITKIYGKVKANNGITFSIMEGSIHGLLGENGAGKSTLMKILSGYIGKTEGTIIVDGKETDFQRPGDASKAGIGMLYQDPMDFPQLTVLENFILGQEHGFFLSVSKKKKRFSEICSNLGFDLDPGKQVRLLTVGERQQLEMVRLIASGARTIILDEPTTGISNEQKTVLFNALKKLAAQGNSLVIVSHKLEDVEILCDRVTVLKEGRISGEMEAPFNTSGILSMMFEALPAMPPKPEIQVSDEILSIKNISLQGGRTGLKDCTLAIRAGETVGLAGLEGSGQELFLRAVSGVKRILKGKIILDDLDLSGRKVSFFKDSGISFLPTDRLVESLVPGMTIEEHCALNDQEKSFFIRKDLANKDAQEKIARFRIKGRPDSPVESLSGGNQQRFMLSLLPEKPRILLLENPTRGLDVESANWVWTILTDYSKKTGTTIIFSSPEIDEIMSISSRVLVFFDGRIIMDVNAGDASSEEIGRAIAGKNDMEEN